MKYEIQETSSLERAMTVIIDANIIKDKVKDKLIKLSHKVKISGFRPGKIPFDIMQKRYGQGARQEVVSDVIQEKLNAAFIEAKVHPVSMPKITKIDDSEEQVSFTATFEVKPEIKFVDCANLELEKLESEVLSIDVDNMIDKLRKQSADWKECTEVAADGMKVEVDFVGTIDGVAFDGGAGNNIPFILGSNSMLKEFEEGFIGMRNGDSKDIKVNFPETYHEKSLAGKQANFFITLQKTFAQELPELNDDFFAKFGVKEGGEKKFREKIQSNMNVELQQRQVVLFQEEVFSKFAGLHEVDLPTSMVTQEIERLRKNMMEKMKQYGMAPKASDFPDEQFVQKAEEQVKLALLLTEYIQQKKITVNEDKVSEKIDLIAKTYDDSDAVKQWFYSDEEQLSKIRSQVLEEQVAENIAKNSKVKVKNMDYNAIISK